MQARGGGANLPTAMVQFCAIISAPFHLRAHFGVPHLNFQALLGVSLSKDTLPGPNNKPCRPTPHNPLSSPINFFVTCSGLPGEKF